jgi:hypothetical protein
VFDDLDFWAKTPPAYTENKVLWNRLLAVVPADECYKTDSGLAAISCASLLQQVEAELGYQPFGDLCQNSTGEIYGSYGSYHSDQISLDGPPITVSKVGVYLKNRGAMTSDGITVWEGLGGGHCNHGEGNQSWENVEVDALILSALKVSEKFGTAAAGPAVECVNAGYSVVGATPAMVDGFIEDWNSKQGCGVLETVGSCVEDVVTTAINEIGEVVNTVAEEIQKLGEEAIAAARTAAQAAIDAIEDAAEAVINQINSWLSFRWNLPAVDEQCCHQTINVGSCPIEVSFCWSRSGWFYADAGSISAAGYRFPSAKIKINQVLSVTVSGDCDEPFSIEQTKRLLLFKSQYCSGYFIAGFGFEFENGLHGSVRLEVPVTVVASTVAGDTTTGGGSTTTGTPTFATNVSSPTTMNANLKFGVEINALYVLNFALHAVFGLQGLDIGPSGVTTNAPVISVEVNIGVSVALDLSLPAFSLCGGNDGAVSDWNDFVDSLPSFGFSYTIISESFSLSTGSALPSPDSGTFDAGTGVGPDGQPVLEDTLEGATPAPTLATARRRRTTFATTGRRRARRLASSSGSSPLPLSQALLSTQIGIAIAQRRLTGGGGSCCTNAVDNFRDAANWVAGKIVEGVEWIVAEVKGWFGSLFRRRRRRLLVNNNASRFLQQEMAANASVAALRLQVIALKDTFRQVREMRLTGAVIPDTVVVVRPRTNLSNEDAIKKLFVASNLSASETSQLTAAVQMQKKAYSAWQQQIMSMQHANTELIMDIVQMFHTVCETSVNRSLCGFHTYGKNTDVKQLVMQSLMRKRDNLLVEFLAELHTGLRQLELTQLSPIGEASGAHCLDARVELSSSGIKLPLSQSGFTAVHDAIAEKIGAVDSCLNAYCEQSRQAPVESWYFTEFENITSPQLFSNLAASHSGASASVDFLIPTPLVAPWYYQAGVVEVRAFLLPGTHLVLSDQHDLNAKVHVDMYKQNFDTFFDSNGRVHQFFRGGGYGYCDVHSSSAIEGCQSFGVNEYHKVDCKPTSGCQPAMTQAAREGKCKDGKSNMYSPCEFAFPLFLCICDYN